MRFYSQSFLYDDPWSIVSYAFFMRYPNPLASHVLSCDVVSRTLTPSGTLLTTRLILKSGALPRWAPKGIVSRAESWVVEESEVDPAGRVVRCSTRNLDHVKVMRVEERVIFQQMDDGKTFQNTEARFASGFGWGLTKKIESHGLAKFKANIQRSRQGFSMILDLIRQSRMRPMTMGAPAEAYLPAHYSAPSSETNSVDESSINSDREQKTRASWLNLKSWLKSS
ncbi:MSF1-domain-containing protein [Laetiporus sulphureus 93-53]|uniref:MSF1-domain-containing protein n=1 Tax=Laetiporus sulphureus 93-53 TaxID=1314785 RepID=A0A165E644_9APHY|nr:MSF1-domain-containing protein [Laetiporus sulphureus 93-53]KZT06310.1 MSF1-domain-containing protein [Laetiporus sulphureus 93-53]